MLVSRIAAGDEEAAGLLQTSYSPVLNSSARSSGLAPEDAEDAVQEALVAAIQQIRADRFRGDACIETWLQSILKHKVQDYWRDYFRRNTHTVSLDALAMSPVYAPVYPSAIGAEELEAAVEVQKVLAGMRDDLRSILLLNQTEGWTISEIAFMTRAPAGTVGRKLAEAKEMFRRRILESALPLETHNRRVMAQVKITAIS